MGVATRALARWGERFRVYSDSRRAWGIALPSLAIALMMAAPLGYMLYYGLQVDGSLWNKLWRTQLPGLLINSLLLATLVTAGAILLGGALAWLVERTDLPGYCWLRPLLIAPLVIPCYIVAIAYVGFVGKRGVLERFLESLGISASIPDLYGLAGTTLVLIFATLPYVFALVGAALRKANASLEEAARSLGLSSWQVAYRVVFPLLAPALLAGAALAALYALSDFGVARAFRYQTFTTAIYDMFSGYERAAASALSLVLMGLTVLVLMGEAQLWKEKHVASDKMLLRPVPRRPLGAWRWLAFGFVWLVLGASFLLPIGIFAYWLLESLTAVTAATWQTDVTELIPYALNSFWLSAIAAFLAINLAILPAYWKGRHPHDGLAQLVSLVAQAGIALPGVLIALGLAFVLLKWAPGLYFSSAALVLVYLVRFFPQAFQAISSGVAQIPERLEEGARLLGCTPWGIFWRILRPLLQPAVLAGWTLVFLNAVRELPATLLLRPAGFDTLAVRVWTAAAEGYYGQAAPAALLLIVLSLPLLFFIWREHKGAIS